MQNWNILAVTFRSLWSGLHYIAAIDTNYIFRNPKSKSDNDCGYCTTTLAVKSFLHSVSLQLFLALSARDNLESLFSYVEEAERNHGWRLQICELQLYSPFPFLSLSLSLSLWVHSLTTGRRNRRSFLGRTGGWPGPKIRESDPVVFSSLTTVQHRDSLWHLRCQQKGFLTLHVELIHLFVISIQDLERYKAD